MRKKALIRVVILPFLLLLMTTGTSLADASAWLKQAEQLFKEGQYEQAEAIYQQGVTDRRGTHGAFQAQKQLIRHSSGRGLAPPLSFIVRSQKERYAHRPEPLEQVSTQVKRRSTQIMPSEKIAYVPVLLDKETEILVEAHVVGGEQDIAAWDKMELDELGNQISKLSKKVY